MSTLLERMQHGFDRDPWRTWRETLAAGENNAYGYDGLSQVLNAARGNLNLNATAIAGVPAAAGGRDWNKAYKIWIFIAIFAFDLWSLEAAEKTPPFVSAIALIAAPRDFDGLKIVASGWLYLQIENDKIARAWLFPSPNHVRVHDFPSSIVIDEATLAEALKNRYRAVPISRLHGAYIVFTGTFSANNPKAPGNLGIGEIHDVVDINGLDDLQNERQNDVKR